MAPLLLQLQEPEPIIQLVWPDRLSIVKLWDSVELGLLKHQNQFIMPY